MTATAYTVTGMNCEHCVRSVTEELERLPEVSSVAVDLADGRVTVVSDGALADGAVREAVTEAGFELVGRA
ncbi:heavy-metal-associated domain-containing protein [Frankia sp. AiPs1]|uniref:heavy-metal-associated domain-containing protein n=1 Tax=Frankia sp. AiPs1 TaxID=573493 RepID=UPI002044092C|nr:heavy-metal-associated domain-containing protein [Frankia sp. AiPs1]MCM3925984.1 heavy-metal-associated domain-containing protein [Frankia sp. AiPs1]